MILILVLKIIIIMKRQLSKFFYFFYFFSLSEFSKCKEIIFKIRLNENEYKNLMKEKSKKNSVKSFKKWKRKFVKKIFLVVIKKNNIFLINKISIENNQI
jgi:hypothetical protein